MDMAYINSIEIRHRKYSDKSCKEFVCFSLVFHEVDWVVWIVMGFPWRGREFQVN